MSVFANLCRAINVMCLEGNNHFKEILSNLESRRTGTVDFKEFMSFVANFAVAVEFSFVNEPETDED
ncbi:unnamed protein product [Ranitomeya imitator]|uniref:EF-hand domain-containing protein n=1 Tax=Ranitomeya imitator TaxID=111125 RepID=A0ABN9LDI5_9NEOB|nr:unnamed protein product [Ranitomeya imitator]